MKSAIAIQVASGRTVFVDITADWCLTCKANKQFVLSRRRDQPAVCSRAISSPCKAIGPIMIVNITNFLHKYRRYGIPFDVVYSPGAPEGITLPEILSHDAVVEALNKASTH